MEELDPKPTPSEDVKFEFCRRVQGSKGIYELQHVLGAGGFGVVWKARCTVTEKLFAVKKVRIASNGIKEFVREVRAMKNIDHPNVLAIHDCLLTPDKRTGYIVTEYMGGGSLFDLMLNSTLNEREVRFYFRQIMLAVQACHKNHIYHHDLKPQNVLLDEDRKSLRLADFGLSMKSAGKLCQVYGGTKLYMAPEMYSRHLVGYEGGAADIFSCGVILHQMLSNATHWALCKEPLKTALRQKTIRCQDFEYPDNASAEACHLMHMMLNPTPRNRISATEVLHHPWMKGGKMVSFRMIGDMEAPIVMVILMAISENFDLRQMDVGGRLYVEVTNKEFQLWQQKGADICLRVIELEDGATAVEGFLLSGPAEVFKKVYLGCFKPRIKRILGFSVEWERLSTSARTPSVRTSCDISPFQSKKWSSINK